MLTEMREMAGRLAGWGQAFDPACLSGDDAEAVVDTVVAMERSLAAIRVRAAKRAADVAAWQRAGCASAEEWLAKKTGVTKQQAERALELGGQLERHEATREALASGAVSETQAGV
ncbi:MAG TPA: hypothetical protein VM618_07810, partial [Acidimicrobiia bacterium]|nr:hypothetical protein [Acidimicrobiia bacterium]